MKLRSGVLKKRNKMDKTLAWQTKKKRTQINIIRKEKDVTIDTTEIKNHRLLWTIIHQQIRQSKMDKFLETYKLLRPNHDVIENLNQPITCKEIQSVIKKPPNKQKSSTTSFAGEFYQILKCSKT